jgi:hypothetical protein
MIRGAMYTAALLVRVQDVMAPELCTGDIVAWDNLGIHEAMK